MHLVILTHLSLFWVIHHPSRTFPPKDFEREPQNRLSHSSHRQTKPSLSSDPWLTTFVMAGYRLVVLKPCACSTSMCVHGLSATHAFAMTWRLICTFYFLILTSCGVNGSLSLRSYVLLPSWTGPCLIVGHYFSNPFFAPFTDLLALLPCYSVIPVVSLFDPCLLGLF